MIHDICPPQLLTETVSCCVEPQAGSAATLTMNTPRLPAPFFVVTVITLDPLPSIRNSETPRVKLFPLPAIEALMVRVPVAFTIVNTADPVLCAVSLWLNERLLGLMDDTHCAAGVAVGDGLAEGVGVGDGLPLPLPFPLLSPGPLPLPLLLGVGVGVAVGVGVGVGVGVASGSPPPSIGGVPDGVGVGVGVGVESTSPVTSAISTGGIS